MRSLILSILILALTSCTAFSDEQERFVNAGIALQPTALGDPRFDEIMRQLDRNGHIIWEDRLNDKATEVAANYPNKVEWLLDKYRTDGGLPREKLTGWTKWYWPISDTTAAYSPKKDMVKLNLLKFNKNEYALANTFVHERNHMFGLVHKGQTRNGNKCDPGYLSGDLAEALVRSTHGDSSSSPHTPACPSLCNALEERELWSQCKF